MDELTRNSCVIKGMTIQDLCYQRVVFWLCEKRRRYDELMTQTQLRMVSKPRRCFTPTLVAHFKLIEQN